MSILIAEDNVAQRRYLREILEREFAAHSPVIEAGDGEETIELALKHRPELCVLDIQMPKLSGVKAARAIWKEYPKARIIFLKTTGSFLLEPTGWRNSDQTAWRTHRARL